MAHEPRYLINESPFYRIRHEPEEGVYYVWSLEKNPARANKLEMMFKGFLSAEEVITLLQKRSPPIPARPKPIDFDLDDFEI